MAEARNRLKSQSLSRLKKHQYFNMGSVLSRSISRQRFETPDVSIHNNLEILGIRSQPSTGRPRVSQDVVYSTTAPS